MIDENWPALPAREQCFSSKKGDDHFVYFKNAYGDEMYIDKRKVQYIFKKKDTGEVKIYLSSGGWRTVEGDLDTVKAALL